MILLSQGFENDLMKASTRGSVRPSWAWVTRILRQVDIDAHDRWKRHDYPIACFEVNRC